MLPNYISASCVISNNEVYKDGIRLFKSGDLTFEGFALAVYQYLNLNYPKFYKMDNLSKLGWLASEVLLRDVFQKPDHKPEDVGLILTNANSSLDADVKYWSSAQDVASPSLFVYTLPNIVTGEICIRNGFKGEDAFYITPQFDAAFIKKQADHLLDNHILTACICGWVDVFNQDYKAALFLVEKRANGINFTREELERVFNII